MIDAIIGIKALVLCTMNLQSFCWWRNHKSNCYTATIRFLLIVSNVIIILEFFYRFTDKELKILFILLSLSDWLVLFALTLMVRPERPWRKNPQNIPFICMIPFHFGYFAVFVMGVKSEWSGSVDCEQSFLYPPMMLINDGLFFSLYVISLVFHKVKYFRRWDLHILPEDQVTYDNFVKNEEQKLKKE